MCASCKVPCSWKRTEKIMSRIITIIALVLLAFSSNAQEKFIVRGHFRNFIKHKYSDNFQINMLCYLKSNAVLGNMKQFEVDSVLSGSFIGFNNEIRQVPFSIPLYLINESSILDYLNHNKTYILKINQVPYTNYYYVDSLKNVLSDDNYQDKLEKYHNEFQQNVDTLISGTSQGKYHILNKFYQNHFSNPFKDFRYIPYVLPLITTKDSIVVDYIITGSNQTFQDKELFSDFLRRYLNRIMPSSIPPKTTDSIGWHDWYNNLLSRDCFIPIKYATSEHKTLAENSPIPYLFIPTTKRKLYISNRHIWDAKKEILIEMPNLKGCKTPVTYSTFHKNEIAYRLGNNIAIAALTNGVFCLQKEEIQLNLGFAWNDDFWIRHHNDDFLVFYPDGINEDSIRTRKCSSILKVGRINRKGEWIMQPKNIYKSLPYKDWCTNKSIRVLSLYQSPKNEFTLAFADKIDIKSSITETAYTNAIVVCKLNKNMEITNTVTYPTDFRCLRYSAFSETYLLKNDKSYLLLLHGGLGSPLYYKVLNDDLTPITDFILLANDVHYGNLVKPISTSEGFLISWVDNEFSENVVRSVLIDKLGIQSRIINIANQETHNIYITEFDKKRVDFFLFNRDEKTLIRKRINKKEYEL